MDSPPPAAQVNTLLPRLSLPFDQKESPIVGLPW